MRREEGWKKLPIPPSLELRILAIRVARGCEWAEACEEAAIMIDHSKMDKLVEEKALVKYRSRHLTELNKARETIRSRAYDLGYSNGYSEGHKKGHEVGFNKGYNDFRSSYGTIESRCSVCGKTLRWELDDKDSKAQIMQMLERGGLARWSHAECSQYISSAKGYYRR